MLANTNSTSLLLSIQYINLLDSLPCTLLHTLIFLCESESQVEFASICSTVYFNTKSTTSLHLKIPKRVFQSAAAEEPFKVLCSC